MPPKVRRYWSKDLLHESGIKTLTDPEKVEVLVEALNTLPDDNRQNLKYHLCRGANILSNPDAAAEVLNTGEA